MTRLWAKNLGKDTVASVYAYRHSLTATMLPIIAFLNRPFPGRSPACSGGPWPWVPVWGATAP